MFFFILTPYNATSDKIIVSWRVWFHHFETFRISMLHCVTGGQTAAILWGGIFIKVTLFVIYISRFLHKYLLLNVFTFMQLQTQVVHRLFKQNRKRSESETDYLKNVFCVGELVPRTIDPAVSPNEVFVLCFWTELFQFLSDSKGQTLWNTVFAKTTLAGVIRFVRVFYVPLTL